MHWIDVAWVAFAIANLAAMLVFGEWETVPFHFIWVSLTLLYGFRVWRVQPTLWVLAAVMILTAGAIGIEVGRNAQPIDEITEVPLMAAMFVAMVWHARRRLTAMEEIERVSKANARLLERERRFIQDASHELRTPITVALGHAQLIQRTATDQTIGEDARIIADELLRLRRLADRLLLLAGPDDPDFLHRIPVDVETVVMAAFHRWEATPRRWLLGHVVDATVVVDADRLAVAMDALIENAVQHTSPHDSIEVATRRETGSVAITVRDSGVGIEPDDLNRIFDRFARSDPGRSRVAGGFGLGLSIVKTIVDAHGGSVRVRSAPGRGSVFELRLPVSDSPLRLPEASAPRESVGSAGTLGP